MAFSGIAACRLYRANGWRSLCSLHLQGSSVPTNPEQHSFSRPWFLAGFLLNASTMQSSQGTVNSIRTSSFEASDRMTMSGHRDVAVMCAGNLKSCLSRFTISCQSCPVESRPVADLGHCFNCSPTLIKVICFFLSEGSGTCLRLWLRRHSQRLPSAPGHDTSKTGHPLVTLDNC